jgi:hypothetical protein
MVAEGESIYMYILYLLCNYVDCSSDGREYALKQIEGTGISMSACREIAVSSLFLFSCVYFIFFAVRIKVMMYNATFNNISVKPWWSVLLV